MHIDRLLAYATLIIIGYLDTIIINVVLFVCFCLLYLHCTLNSCRVFSSSCSLFVHAMKPKITENERIIDLNRLVIIKMICERTYSDGLMSPWPMDTVHLVSNGYNYKIMFSFVFVRSN